MGQAVSYHFLIMHGFLCGVQCCELKLLAIYLCTNTLIYAQIFPGCLDMN